MYEVESELGLLGGIQKGNEGMGGGVPVAQRRGRRDLLSISEGTTRADTLDRMHWYHQTAL